MQELIPKHPSENRVSYLVHDGVIADVWLDDNENSSPSITFVLEKVIQATDPCDWWQDYYTPDGRMIRACLKSITDRVPISSWQAVLERPENYLISARL